MKLFSICLLFAAGFLSSCVDPMLASNGTSNSSGSGSRVIYKSYSKLPSNHRGPAYYHQGRYYTGGQYQTGSYSDKGRKYTSRYYHNGRYYYGGEHRMYHESRDFQHGDFPAGNYTDGNYQGVSWNGPAGN